MGSHDLTFVAPERRDEVMRRIAVIESFLAKPGPESAAAHAEQLGLRKSQFYTLAKAWKESRRPEALAGAGLPKVRRMSISAEQAAFMDQVISDHPTNPTPEIVNAITELGVNMVMPHRDVVARYVSRARPRLLPADVDRTIGLIVDFTVLDMPVEFDADRPVRPVATIVIDTRQEAAVGLSLADSAGARPAAEALVDAVRRGRRSALSDSSAERRIARPDLASTDWRGLDAIVQKAGFSVETQARGAYEHGQLAEALFGRNFGGIHLRPRLVAAAPERRRSKEADERKWLTPEDALQIARGRFVGGKTTTAFSSLDDVTRRILEEGLAAQAPDSTPPR